MRSSGSRLTTGWLAATHSPGRKKTSSTRAAEGAGGDKLADADVDFALAAARLAFLRAGGGDLGAAGGGGLARGVEPGDWLRASAAWAASMSLPATAAGIVAADRQQAVEVAPRLVGVGGGGSGLGLGLLGIGLRRWRSACAPRRPARGPARPGRRGSRDRS